MPTFKHLEQQTQHGSGKLVHYVKINGRRVRLRAEVGSPKFRGEYAAAVAHLSTQAPPAERRHCDKCGNLFPVGKPWQRFCSTKCRMSSAGSDRYAASRDALRALKFIAAELAKAPASPHVDAALRRARSFTRD